MAPSKGVCPKLQLNGDSLTNSSNLRTLYPLQIKMRS